MQFKYVKLNDFPGVERYFLHANRKPYIILRFDKTERWKIMLTDKDGNMRSIGHEFLVAKNFGYRTDEDIQYNVDVISTNSNTYYPFAVFDSESECYEWIRNIEVNECLEMIKLYTKRAGFVNSEKYLDKPWKNTGIGPSIEYSQPYIK